MWHFLSNPTSSVSGQKTQTRKKMETEALVNSPKLEWSAKTQEEHDREIVDWIVLCDCTNEEVQSRLLHRYGESQYGAIDLNVIRLLGKRYSDLTIKRRIKNFTKQVVTTELINRYRSFVNDVVLEAVRFSATDSLMEL